MGRKLSGGDVDTSRSLAASKSASYTSSSRWCAREKFIGEGTVVIIFEGGDHGFHSPTSRDHPGNVSASRRTQTERELGLGGRLPLQS